MYNTYICTLCIRTRGNRMKYSAVRRRETVLQRKDNTTTLEIDQRRRIYQDKPANRDRILRCPRTGLPFFFFFSSSSLHTSLAPDHRRSSFVFENGTFSPQPRKLATQLLHTHTHIVTPIKIIDTELIGYNGDEDAYLLLDTWCIRMKYNIKTLF